MAKKLGAPIALGVFTVLAILLLTTSGSKNDDILQSTFEIQAEYYDEDGYIQINFKDTSDNTNAIVLEVLGMDETFQKTYLDSSEFTEIISFPNPPKYGWEIHPVTLQIDHKDLGKVSIKTEIRPSGDPPAPIIYGNP
jgi:hypothetical protein